MKRHGIELLVPWLVIFPIMLAPSLVARAKPAEVSGAEVTWQGLLAGGYRFKQGREAPAILGSYFGFFYVVNGTPDRKRVKVKEVFVFPRNGVLIDGERIKRLEESRKVRIGEENMLAWEMEDEGELAEGE